MRRVLGMRPALDSQGRTDLGNLLPLEEVGKVVVSGLGHLLDLGRIVAQVVVQVVLTPGEHHRRSTSTTGQTMSCHIRPRPRLIERPLLPVLWGSSLGLMHTQGEGDDMGGGASKRMCFQADVPLLYAAPCHGHLPFREGDGLLAIPRQSPFSFMPPFLTGCWRRGRPRRRRRIAAPPGRAGCTAPACAPPPRATQRQTRTAKQSGPALDGT
jgi:hypothetical protein